MLHEEASTMIERDGEAVTITIPVLGPGIDIDRYMEYPPSGVYGELAASEREELAEDVAERLAYSLDGLLERIGFAVRSELAQIRPGEVDHPERVIDMALPEGFSIEKSLKGREAVASSLKRRAALVDDNLLLVLLRDRGIEDCDAESLERLLIEGFEAALDEPEFIDYLRAETRLANRIAAIAVNHAVEAYPRRLGETAA